MHFNLLKMDLTLGAIILYTAIVGVFILLVVCISVNLYVH